LRLTVLWLIFFKTIINGTYSTKSWK
jgi:hypothetical protein